MWRSMNGISKFVVILLLLMLVRAAGFAVDRYVAYRVAQRQSNSFVQEAAAALHYHDFDEAISIARRGKRSHIARLVVSALMDFRAAPPFLSRPEIIATAKAGMRRSAAIVRCDLKRGLSTLATIASTAPFVGLFGTEIGILDAFKGCEGSRQYCLSATAAGIAEALLTTALGMLVAVPHTVMRLSVNRLPATSRWLWGIAGSAQTIRSLPLLG
jgi:biopolymer transport protein ExbB/TolQ